MNTVAQVSTAKTAELVAFYNKHNPEKTIKKFADRATAEKRVIDLIDTLAEKAATSAKTEVAVIEPVQELIALEEPDAPAIEAPEAPAPEPEAAPFKLGAIHKRVLINIARSEYTEVNGSEPENNHQVGSVWLNCVVSTAAEKRAVEELIRHAILTHDNGVGAERCVAMTAEGFAAYKAIPSDEAATATTESEKAYGSNSAGVAASWADPKVVAARLKRDGVVVQIEGADAAVSFRSVRKAFEELGLPDAKHIRFRMKLKESKKEVFEFNGKKFTFTIEE